MSRDQISVPPKSNAFNMPTPVITQTRLPSVTGEGEDMFCLRWKLLPPAMGRFQTTSFLLRSIAQSSSAPVSRAVATFRKMRSPQMMGVEPLNAGSGSFHATFSVALQVEGSPVSALTPFPVGPRQFGQLSAKSVALASITTHVTVNNLRMPDLLG